MMMIKVRKKMFIYVEGVSSNLLPIMYLRSIKRPVSQENPSRRSLQQIAIPTLRPQPYLYLPISLATILTVIGKTNLEKTSLFLLFSKSKLSNLIQIAEV